MTSPPRVLLTTMPGNQGIAGDVGGTLQSLTGILVYSWTYQMFGVTGLNDREMLTDKTWAKNFNAPKNYNVLRANVRGWRDSSMIEISSSCRIPGFKS